MTYVLKCSWHRTSLDRVVTVPDDQLRVTHPQITRVKGRLGPFTELEGTGKRDKKRVELRLTDGVGERGDKVSRDGATMPVSEVRNHVRRLRDEDAEKLAALDTEIAEANATLRELRDRRRKITRRAFTYGTPVPGSTLTELIKED